MKAQLDHSEYDDELGSLDWFYTSGLRYLDLKE